VTGTANPQKNLVFFLGGHDLEMITIREVLERYAPDRVHDRKLGWGAKASAYRDEIEAAIKEGQTPVLIELEDDLGLTAYRDGRAVVVVDHHGPAAGKDQRTSLEQVFELAGLPAEDWTHWFALIAANDRGHVKAMQAIGASVEEMRQVREADRRAQGVTAEQEAEGRRAAEAAETFLGGRLTVVRLAHNRTASVTDALDPNLGRKGYQNLLVLGGGETNFFGAGRAVRFLQTRFPGGWSGGELPERGYWGYSDCLDFAQLFATLKDAITTRPATEISVRIFHNILIWPLLLRGKPDPGGDTTVLQKWLKVFEKQGWQIPPEETKAWAIQGPSGPEYPISREYSYEEIIYFHPFVRDFLFGDGMTEPEYRPLRRLTRTDIKRVQVGIRDMPGPDLNLAVERLELYLCKPNIALLVVEVSNCHRPGQEGPDYRELADYRPEKLDILLDFQDRWRRIDPPFWWDEKCHGLEAEHPGLCPLTVQWFADVDRILDRPGTTFEPTSPKKIFDDFSHRGAEPPVFNHWRYFFHPLEPAATRHDLKSSRAAPLFYQQIFDERIPAMSFFAIDNPLEVSEGDFDRMAFFDSSGSDSHPYNPSFLDRERERYLYDRFAHEGTKYLCSGYGFAVSGRAQKEGGSDLSFFADVLRRHFRHHYFRMGLIAHYQRAALLFFADELSDAIKDPKDKGPKEELKDPVFRDRIENIQMQFLKFRSRGYFPEVTNQLQGRELFQLWFQHLGTETLFKQVDETSQRLYEALAENETRGLGRAQTVLGIIGFIALPISLVLSAAQVVTGLEQGWMGWSVMIPIAIIALGLFFSGIWIFWPGKDRLLSWSRSTGLRIGTVWNSICQVLRAPRHEVASAGQRIRDFCKRFFRW
jgi:hypothetical protein